MKMTTKLKRSAVADSLLLEIVRKSPGLSLYELHNRLKWSIGKVDGSKNRLLAAKKVSVTEINRNGRHVALLYAWSKQQQHSTLGVPKSQLHVSNPAWKEESIFYALDTTNIGISGERYAEWEKFAFLKAKVKPVSTKKKVILNIPKQFVTFYDLEHKHYTPSIAQNRILLTIDGDIVTNLPDKKR